MGKVAITGGSGFIGTALVNECLKRDHNVILFDKSKPEGALGGRVKWVGCDITCLDTVDQVMANERPDMVFLLAGVLGTEELDSTPHKAVLNNVLGVSTFMELAVKGALPPTFFVTKPNVWDNLYTFSKEASEKIVRYYIRQGKITGAIHKWFNVYGPGQHTHPVRKAVPHFIMCALLGKPISIWGTGNQTVDLIYVDDVAHLAMEAMMGDRFTGEAVVDIGSGAEVSVNDLARKIIQLTNSKSELVWKPMRGGEVPDTILVADTREMRGLVKEGFEFLDLEVGLMRTIEYYSKLPQAHYQAFCEFYHL